MRERIETMKRYHVHLAKRSIYVWACSYTVSKEDGKTYFHKKEDQSDRESAFKSSEIVGIDDSTAEADGALPA